MSTNDIEFAKNNFNSFYDISAATKFINVTKVLNMFTLCFFGILFLYHSIPNMILLVCILMLFCNIYILNIIPIFVTIITVLYLDYTFYDNHHEKTMFIVWNVIGMIQLMFQLFLVYIQAQHSAYLSYDSFLNKQLKVSENKLPPIQSSSYPQPPGDEQFFNPLLSTNYTYVQP